jgi:hypothetical protein
LTAMKYGVYALLAAVVGVMLIGMLPSQLSNLVAPTVSRTTTQGGGTEQAKNETLLSGTNVPSHSNTTNTTIVSKGIGDAVTSVNASTIAAYPSGVKTNASSGTETAASEKTPLSDVFYYGMMGIGFLVALTVYFAAKRML